MVEFEAGAGNRMHARTGEQVLIVTEGKGVVPREQGEQLVTAGTIVYTPAHEMHSHGATKDSAFAHVSIQTSGVTRLKP